MAEKEKIEIEVNHPSPPKEGLNIVDTEGGSMLEDGYFISPNFVPGVSGWRINSDGNIEIQDLLARGEITADTLNIGGITEITVESGDNLQTALDKINTKGGGTLRLSPGTYTIAQDLTVYDNTKIIGDSSGNTTIDFNSGAYSIIWLGTNVYTTGTISSVTGTAVVGSSTVWTSAMIGRQIFIDNRWHVIVAVADSTHLTIATAAASYSGSYRIANPINNVVIKGVTIKNSATTALEGTDVRNISLEDVVFVSNNKGMILTNFMNVVIEESVFAASTSNGYELTNGTFFNGYSVAAASNGGSGVVLNNIKACGWILCSSNSNTTDGFNLTDVTNCLFKVELDTNGGEGMEMVSGCNFNKINDSIVNNNGGDGIKLTATCDNNTIGTAIDITNNTSNGINIANANCDNNFILAPQYSGNGTDVSDSGTGTASLTPA